MRALKRSLPRGAPPHFLLVAGAALIRGLFALPDAVIKRLAGPIPAQATGLEADAWMVARLSAVARLPAGERPVAEMRARFELIATPFSPRGALPVRTGEHALAGPGGPLAARLYVPDEAPRRGPLLVYFHGGGWVQGSVASHGPACRLLAHLSGVRVLSVDYRLAPEYPFPAAADDALAAYAHVAEHAEDFGADPARLAVGGDSAGGNLAAVTAQAARVGGVASSGNAAGAGNAGNAARAGGAGEGLPAPAFQLLLYPALDMSRKPDSRRLFGERFLLTEQSMSWYEDQYVPDRTRRGDPRVSPLLAADLAGLASAYIATCLADPLRDEGEAYARRLREAGVRVALQRHPLIHGFFNQTITRGARCAMASVAGALRQGLS